VHSVFFWVFCTIGGSYLLAASAVSIKIALRKGLRYSWILPFVFLTMHGAYGAGFLTGILRVLSKGPA
jgi:hypothetical protein